MVFLSRDFYEKKKCNWLGLGGRPVLAVGLNLFIKLAQANKKLTINHAELKFWLGSRADLSQPNTLFLTQHQNN